MPSKIRKSPYKHNMYYNILDSNNNCYHYIELPCDTENIVLPSGDNFKAVTSLHKTYNIFKYQMHKES